MPNSGFYSFMKSNFINFKFCCLKNVRILLFNNRKVQWIRKLQFRDKATINALAIFS